MIQDNFTFIKKIYKSFEPISDMEVRVGKRIIETFKIVIKGALCHLNCGRFNLYIEIFSLQMYTT